MATKTKTTARKSRTATKTARKVRKASASKARKAVKGKTTARAPRLNPDAKLRVVGENTCREGSRMFRAFEAMRKYRTVGAFLKGYKPASTEVPSTCIHWAVKNDYAKVG